MELTGNQTQNLVQALKAYKLAKKQEEVARQNTATKLGKLKECCGASGAGGEAQVMEAAHTLLAQAYLALEAGGHLTES